MKVTSFSRFNASLQPSATSRFRTHLILARSIAIMATAGVSHAADFTWNAASGSWNVASSWLTGDPPLTGVPAATDNAIFSNNTGDPSIGSSPVVVSLNGSNRTINSMTFQSAGTTTFIPGSGDRNLVLAAGLTINSDAGAVTISTATNTNGITVGSSQTWTNNGTLNIKNSVNPGTLLPEETSKTLTITGTGNTTLSDTARIRNAMTLVKQGSGTLTLSGTIPTNYNYTGGLSVKAGTLSVGLINNSGSSGYLGNSTTPVVLGDTGASTGTLSYTGATASSTKMFTIATDGAGVIAVTEAATTLTLSGVISGSGGLTKSGSGALVISNTALTHNGAITVAGGTLRMNGITDPASAVSVTSGTLAGTGTVNGTINITSGGTVAPGTASTIGTLNTANVTFALGAIFDVDLNATSADHLAVNGDLNLGGATLSAEVLTGAPASFTVFNIATYTNLTGTFNDLDEGDPVVIAGKNYIIKYADGGNNITLTSPEVIATPYEDWATANITDFEPLADATPAGDPDEDGASNLEEFAFNGDPLNGSSNGQVYMLTADSDYAGDPSSAKELILTVAVRTGTAAFAGNPSPTAIQAADGITYTIEGSTTLESFNTLVNVAPTPVDPGVPAGTGYEYRSFSLDGSNGLPGKGFLRAKVAN